MFRVATRHAFAALLSLLAASTQAAPTIDLVITPHLPAYAQNPGGLVTATVSVDTDATTPNTLYLTILNALEEVVYEVSVPGESVYELDWVVPEGLDDGFYRVKVEYWSVEGGLETVAESSFLVAGRTPGVCAFKFIDANGNEQYDEGEVYASGWEMCLSGPNGFYECRVTDNDGAACWFFLPLGHYEMCETQQPPYEPTTPPCQQFDLSGNEVVQLFFGNWIPPVTGACCFCPVGNCEILTLEACLQAGGNYLGDGVPCDPNPCDCPPPLEACCLPDGTCLDLLPEDCLAQGGTPQGPGTNCLGVVCPPTATETTTWGQIKSRYR